MKEPLPVEALLVVDLQQGLVTGPEAPVDGEGLALRITDLVARARAAEVLVVQVQNDGPAGAPDEPDTDGWQLALDPGGDQLVRKETDDAFEATGLETLLRTRDVRRVAVVGMYSEMCVAATVRTALALGLEVLVPHDGHATRPVPAWAGVAAEVPAEQVARVAEWSMGDRVELVPHTTDVRFG